MTCTRIGIDTSKAVFTLHGVDENEQPILRRNLSRKQFIAFASKLEPSLLALEVCGGSHHWGRFLREQGHTVKLIPPQHVKPSVRDGRKNDRNDAEAICEAASRPRMTFVPIKTAEQQAQAMVLGTRDLLVNQRTQTANALRGYATEFGMIAAKGLAQIDALVERFSTNEEIPGIGPITALTLASQVSPQHFKSSRHFASWVGLAPRENSTGGKARLGKISKVGNERIRQLLVVGVMAIIQRAKPDNKKVSPWLLNLLSRRPKKVVAVALANKMARTAWAMMMSGESYRHQPQAA
jgi:transposase